MNVPALPDYLRDRPFEDPTEALLESLGTGAPPILSLRDDRFTLVDAAGGEQPLETFDKGVPYVDCVFIHSNPKQSKIFYDHAYNPNEAGPPTCYSDNGVAPSRNASKPQSPTCPSCQWFPWGSATSPISGKGIKACKDYQKVAIMVPGCDGIYLLRVPPNSLTSLREYTLRFKGTGTSISDILTRVSLVQKTLQFRAVSYIDQGMAQRRNEARQKGLTDALVGVNDQPVTAPQMALVQPAVAGVPAATNAPGPAPQIQGNSAAGAQQFNPSPTPQFTPPSPPPQASPSVPNPAPSGRGRGRGRPPKAGNGQQGAPQGEPATFQPSQAPFPTPSNPQPAQAPQPGSFGISQGAAPDLGLNQALDNFFGPAAGNRETPF